MSDSALMISVGQPIRHEDHLRMPEIGAEEHARWARFKENGSVEGVREYAAIDGNTMQQIGFVILEGSKAQIDALLEDPGFREVKMKYSATFHNATFRRLGMMVD